MKPINCSFTTPEPPQPSTAAVPDTPPNGVRVQLELLRRLGLVSEFDWTKFANSVELQEQLSELINRNYFETLFAQKVHFNPRHVDNWQSWLARHFPSFASDSSAPKKVRNFLMDAKRAGEGLWDVMPFYAGQIDEYLAKMGTAQVIKDAYEQFKNTLKVNGVDFNRHLLGELWIEAIEVGQTDRLLRFTNAGENGKRYLQHRYDMFIEKLTGHGLSEEAVEILLDPVRRVAQAYDELLIVGRNLGVAVDSVQDIGYFNRLLSADAKFRLSKEQADIYGGFLENKAESLGAAFQKSRVTYDFIVEDELLLAAAMGFIEESPKKLRNVVRTKRKTLERIADVRDTLLPKALVDRDNLTKQLSEFDENIQLVKKALKEAQPGEVSKLTNELKSMQRGRDAVAKEKKHLTSRINRWEREIRDIDQVGKELLEAKEELDRLTQEATNKLNSVLTNEKKLLLELSKLSDNTLDALVDSGVLSKLPMTTNDLYKYMVDRYKLPYKGIEELLLVDPVRAYKAATDQLKDVLGKSVMSQALYKDAVDAGWGVTAAQKLENPTEYGKYVLLSDEIYRQFGIEQLPGADKIYLHPVVADMYVSILETSSDPGTLGTFAATWNYVNRIFKKQVLATSGFLGRQLFQLFISSIMSGTNLAELIPGIASYIRFKRIGFEAFDNTKKVFGGGRFTERELMAELMKRGALDGAHKTAPIAGLVEQASTESFSAWNPKNLQRAAGYWASIAQGRGLFPRLKDGKLQWDVVEYGASLFERLTDEASGFIMMQGAFLENAVKLAHFRSTLRDGAANAIGQFATNGRRFHFTDIEEAVKHARDYFFDYGDMGVGDRFISKNIIPFWSYMSRNLPATIRHALRNPTQYMAYQRIYALLNKDARESDAAEGGFSPWQKGFGHVYLPHPNGQPDHWIHLPFTSIDPVADALNTFEEGRKGLAQLFGFFAGDYKEDIEQTSPNNQTIPFIDALIQDGYGSIKSLYGLFSKRDPGRGRILTQDETKTTSFLGVEIPGKHAPLIKFLIENTVPSLNNLNRANPMDIFGLKEQTDADGKVTRPGKRSLFGSERSDADNNKDKLGQDVPLIAALRLTGLTFNSVDLVKNMGYAENDLKTAADDMKRYIKKLEAKKLKELEADAPEQHKKIQDALVAAKALAAEIELGRAKAADWLQRRGKPTTTDKRKHEKEVEKMRLWLEQFNNKQE